MGEILARVLSASSPSDGFHLRPFNPQLHPCLLKNRYLQEWKADTFISMVKRSISFALVINFVIWVDSLTEGGTVKHVGGYLYVLSGMAVKCGLSQEIRQRNLRMLAISLNSRLVDVGGTSIFIRHHNCHSFWAPKVCSCRYSGKLSVWRTLCGHMTQWHRGSHIISQKCSVIMEFPRGWYSHFRARGLSPFLQPHGC